MSRIDRIVLPITCYAVIDCQPGAKFFASVSMLSALARRQDEAPVAHATLTKETL